jgi:hypothetical protein
MRPAKEVSPAPRDCLNIINNTAFINIVSHTQTTVFCNLLHLQLDKISRGSSVSVVSGYELEDQAIEFRSPAETTGFFSTLCVQTGSGAHPASCPVGTGGPFPGGKARPERDADHPSNAGDMNE